MTEHLTVDWLDEARDTLAAQEEPSPVVGMGAIEFFEFLNERSVFAQGPTPSAADCAFVRACGQRLQMRLSQTVERCRRDAV